MRRLILLALLCLALANFAPAGHAQTSVYGAVAITGYGVSNSSSNYLYEKSGSAGFVLGGFYNFPIDSRLTAGIDLRLSNSPGVKGGTAGAVAIRIGLVPHQVRLRPYFELGGGVVSTTTDTELVNDQVKSGTYTNGALLIAAGLDVRVTHSVDIRVLELGAEAGGNTGVGYVDAGIVFHFGLR